MKKIVFAGDSLFTGPQGFFPYLESHILLQYPATSYFLDVVKKEAHTYDSLFHTASASIIGRGPQILVLSLGLQEILGNDSVETILKNAQSSLELLKDKTGATIFCSNVIAGFLGTDNHKIRCRDFNRGLLPLAENLQVRVVDVHREVENFLRLHRAGGGEKRSLYFSGPELYPLGQILLARAFYSHLEKEIDFT